MPKPPVPARAYCAFISYSHRDRAWADWLHRALESWRVPARLVGQATPRGTIPQRLAPIFRDRAELASATDLGREIEEALAHSANLIVICSPAAAASRWVNAEVLAYQRLGRGGRVFCLVVAGDPAAPPGDAHDCFCPALRASTAEPIAADVRKGGDGKADARLKLIAGLLGIGLDALKQREQHRRVQRLAVITALALAVTAGASVLAALAWVARRDAVAASQRAGIAQQAAERRQKQAEDLVGYMLGDLYARLEQLQRLDIVQSVNEKAMTYFAALPATDVNAATLAQRARALEQIGVVRMGLGNLTGALASFEASRVISAPLAATDAGNAAHQVAYARTLAFIGTVHWQQNKLAAAQADFELMLPTLRRLAVAAPLDPEVLLHLALLNHNLGRVLAARNDDAGALAHYREALAVSQRLHAAFPDDDDYAVNLGTAHGDLGRLALQRGDLLTAVSELRANDTLQGQLAARNHQDNLQRQNLLEAQAAFATALALAGEHAQAARKLAEAVDSARQLVKFEPANTDFRLDLAMYSTQLARLRRLGGDAAAAQALSTTAIDTFSSLVRQDPDNVEWQRHQVAALLERAALSRAAAQAGLAEQQLAAALQRLEPLRDERPGDHDILLLAATTRLELAAATPTAATSRALAGDALQLLHADAIAARDPRLLALAVHAHLLLGERPAARALVQQLWQTGYRDAAFLRVLRDARIDYPPNPAFQARLAAAAGSTPAPVPSP